LKVVAFAILFLIVEWGVPLGVWGYACRASLRTEKDFIGRVGRVYFPRTILGVAMVLSGGLEYLFPGSPYLAGAIFVLSLGAYVGCMVWDVFRAAFR
jgi:hypothetical protein